MPSSIVCIDGYTLNPGDLDWKPFETLGRLTVFDRTPHDQIIPRLAGVSIALTNKVPFSAATIQKLPDLNYIGVLATGYNIIDTVSAAARGIVVTNVPSYSTESVAQHTIGLMLELARRIGLHDRAVHEGKWSTSPDFCFSLAPMVELNGKILAIVGVGRIGLAVARIAAAMGMKILALARRRIEGPQLGGLAIEWAKDADDLFSRADILSFHCPLTDDTRNLADARRLGLMKKSALLINCSRGPLIDNQALAAALHAGQIAGAALDVLDVEPPPAGNPLLKAPRCVITPHLGWYAIETRRRLMQIAADNLRAFLSGHPINMVK